MTDPPPHDAVPVSVRLGEVVPPEDPEDWTRPLTWVVALGMLAGPVVAAAWFLAAPPTAADRALPGTFIVAAALAGGAALTGAMQIGRARAWTATLGAGLFAALVVIVVGVATGSERQAGVASPVLAHAFAAAMAGLVGAGGAALVAAIVADVHSRAVRFLAAFVAAIVAALAVVGLLAGRT